MRAVRLWVGHLTALLSGTGRTWWACLPRLLLIQLVTGTGSQVLRLLAALVTELSGWVAVFLIAASFLILLSGMVVSLRVAGDYLQQDPALPEPESGAQRPVTELLSVTLLPFLGIYASFGVVEEAAREVVMTTLLLKGAVFGVTTLSSLDPRTQGEYLVVAGVVVGSYLLRQVIDKIHHRTQVRALGLVAAFVEAFFMLSLLVAGMRLVRRGLTWLSSRQLWSWVADLGQALAAPFRLLRIDLPEAVTVVWEWVKQTGWPTAADTFAEPVLWLALTVLVIGSGVLSIGDLWRRDETPGLLQGAQRRSARRLAHRMRTSSRLRGGWLAFQEAFLGDIDDKYLPTWQSLRLILRVGLTFLGAYLLVYTALRVAVRLIMYAIVTLIGGDSVAFWGAAVPTLDLIERLLLEPLRISLLAVAFHRISTWSEPVATRALPQEVTS